MKAASEQRDGLLLWVWGLNGTEPQKCYDIPMFSTKHTEMPYLSKHVISSSEMRLPISALEKMYPAPEVVPAFMKEEE